jgi:formylglycine-generating enzyme required for sulfatase activity
VLKNLREEAESGKRVTVASLNAYLKRTVSSAVKEVIKDDSEQDPHPLINGRNLDFGLVVSPPEPKQFENVIGMKLAKIPGGKFQMGSPRDEEERSDDEGPQHEVEISEFYLGVYEVTVGQFRAFVKAADSQTEAEKGDGAFGLVGGVRKKEKSIIWKTPGFVRGEDSPVTCVSWKDARAFCDWLNKQADKKRPGGWMYRLPREAEWEYACRGWASSYQVFHLGSSLSSVQANFDGNYPYGGAGKGEYLKRTAKVGSYKANAFGLYDMHGNVWEWCADWCGDRYYSSSPKRDPVGPFKGSNRVIRGGSWRSDGGYCRSAYRGGSTPENRDSSSGFRVALVPSSRGTYEE